MERRLAAILAADVVGYSRLMGEDEVGTLARLQSCRPELVDLAMHRIRDAYAADASAPNLLLHPFFREAVKMAEPNWRKMADGSMNCPPRRRSRFTAIRKVNQLKPAESNPVGDRLRDVLAGQHVREEQGPCRSTAVTELESSRTCRFSAKASLRANRQSKPDKWPNRRRL